MCTVQCAGILLSNTLMCYLSILIIWMKDASLSVKFKVQIITTSIFSVFLVISLPI